MVRRTTRSMFQHFVVSRNPTEHCLGYMGSILHTKGWGLDRVEGHAQLERHTDNHRQTLRIRCPCRVLMDPIFPVCSDSRFQLLTGEGELL